MNKKAFIIFKKRRYRCKCGKAFLEDYSFVAKHQRMTKRTFFSIYEKLGHEYSFTVVGKELGISTNTVIRAFDKIEYPEADLDGLEVLSIDEFKGNTGGEKYNCILADPKNKVVLDILPKRYSTYLTSYFRNIPRENREKIKYFVSDMWKTYQEMSEVFSKILLL